jgi:Dolichyl-phosphate-mannose-protein mannosyltransferase
MAPTAARETTQRKFWSAWRWWLAPAIVALVLILIFVDPFIGDWDALEYTVSALHGYPSSMALGRSLFIFYNHALYLVAHAVFGLAPQHAYLLFKYTVVVQGPLVVVACWTLARDLTRSLHAATIAALLVTFSPVFVLYSGQVMTDVPALLLLTIALIIHLRGIRLRRVWLVMVGAALLGVGVNLRETVAFYGPWLALAPFVCGWKPARRELAIVALSCALFLIAALGGFGYWFLTDPSFRQAWFGWRHAMAVEASRHPVGLRNLVPFIAYFFVTSPLTLISLPFAFKKEWRERRLSPLLLLAGVGLFANALLLLNYSTAIVWRYPLCGLPALAPLSGNYLVSSLTRRFRSAPKAVAICAAAIALLAVLFGLLIRPVSRQFIERRSLSKEYNVQLEKLPRDAVVIPGAQSVAVKYWRGIGQGDWEVIGAGSGWPGDRLGFVIEDYLKQGRRIFVDADPRWWPVCGWQREEISDLIKLESQFHFRRAFNTIYEIKSIEDVSAQDSPNLRSLLPENRPEEVGRCPPFRW